MLASFFVFAPKVKSSSSIASSSASSSTSGSQSSATAQATANGMSSSSASVEYFSEIENGVFADDIVDNNKFIEDSNDDDTGGYLNNEAENPSCVLTVDLKNSLETTDGKLKDLLSKLEIIEVRQVKVLNLFIINFIALGIIIALEIILLIRQRQ